MPAYDRDPIDKAVKAMLGVATQRPGDLVRAPLNAVMPYWVLYPQEGGEQFGSLADPEEGQELPYQVTSVGKRGDQATMMADRVWHAFMDRNANGLFKYPITVVGVAISDRRVDGGRGALDRSTSPGEVHEVYSVVQHFIICASPV